MTEFEKKLLADLEAGHDVNEILDEFKSRLNTAVEEYEAKQAKEKAEAEAKAQREVEQTGVAIAELANRMLTKQLTADDVAWVLQTYFSQVAENVQVEFTAKDAEDLRHTACGMMNGFAELMESAFNAVKPGKHSCKCESDDDILRDFVQKIL